MSRVDEADLVSKFISALTLFSERTASLESRVLVEMNAMRNDIQQLKQTISAEHNTVSLPRVMEQQRMTMIELFRQIQPILSVVPPTAPAQHSQIQPPTVAAIAPIQQPIVPPAAPLQQLVAPIPQQPVISQPIQSIQQPAVNVAPIQPQANVSAPQAGLLREGEWYCTGCYLKNAANLTSCVCCMAPKPGTQQTANVPKPAATAFKPQTFTATTNASAAGMFGVSQPAAAQPAQKPKEEPQKINFTFKPNTAATASPTPSSTTGLFGTGQKSQQEQKPISFQFTPKSGSASPASNVGTPQQEQKPVNFMFTPQNVSKSSSVTSVEPKSENKGIFGTGASPAAGQSLFGGGAGSKLTFGGVASNTSGNASFLNQSGSNANVFKVDPKQHQLFSGAKAAGSKKHEGDDEGGADETAPEEFVPDDAQFKRPDIALPDLVDVRTGEEGEEVMFSARCRLYRFANGEVKERGTGDLKLLKNRDSGKIRCVMRREQVLKLCANFSIPPGFAVNNTKRGENVLTWACNDFSDPETPDGEYMTLICRFKDVDTAKKFKEIAQSA